MRTGSRVISLTEGTTRGHNRTERQADISNKSRRFPQTEAKHGDSRRRTAPISMRVRPEVRREPSCGTALVVCIIRASVSGRSINR